MNAPGITLFALPHAGGMANGYLPLGRHLRSDILLDALDLPGHGRRLGQPLLRSIPALAAGLLDELAPRLSAPYAILGHSMGALVGLEMCRAAALAGLPLPRRLIVSGCAAPGHSGLPPDLPDRPAPRFWEAIRQFGGLPDEVLAEPEILELFEPVLRADLQAVADYRPAGLGPLPLAISVLAGRDDRLTQGRLAAWQDETGLPVDWRSFDGGHFYLFQHLAAVAALVNAL